MKQRTPLTLDEAIEHAAHAPDEYYPELGREWAYIVIKDFIANKMQAPMLNANEKEQQILGDLFEQLTRRIL